MQFPLRAAVCALVGIVVCTSGVAAAETLSPGPSGEKPVEFVREVIPVLTKAGCNAGGCHGAFSGRGGFRLSLWGFDPVADHLSLVKESRGRRINLSAPTASLIIQKPTTEVRHGGGRKLDPGTESYDLLVRWISQGAPGPLASDPQLVRLEVTPRELTLAPGKSLAIKVQAIWSDGVVQDATRWAQFESNAAKVATVTPNGELTTVASGGAAVTVRFLGQVGAVAVTVPYESTSSVASSANAAMVDRHIVRQWQKVGLTPAPRSDDGEFVRRVHLDIIGALPTVDETRAFLDSTDPAKRAKLIDALLNRPEYADYWTMRWSDLLRVHRRALGDKGLASFAGWMRDSFRTNKPMNKIVSEMLVSKGNLYSNGPVAFYFINANPQEQAETAAQVFLGIRMQCARCHHHPFEVWAQDDYYGLAGFFARVERKDNKEAGRFGGAQAVKLASEGSLPHPTTGQPVVPHVLGQPPVVIEPGQDGRELLAAWMTAPENPYFARNIVNRYWGYMLGRGLVEPIDDLRASNPASHPELLEELTRDFVAHGFDVKHLIRTICNSVTYQLATEIAPTRDQDGQFFTHRSVRKLSAEVMLDAISQATGSPEVFDSFPVGTSAVSLPDPMVKSYFLETFGRPQRVSSCECERPAKPDLRQVLHLANGQLLQAKIAATTGRVAKLLAASATDEQLTEELYLAALSRRPRADELQEAREIIAAAPTRPEGCEDLLWTIINLTEFGFNH